MQPKSAASKTLQFYERKKRKVEHVFDRTRSTSPVDLVATSHLTRGDRSIRWIRSIHWIRCRDSAR